MWLHRTPAVGILLGLLCSAAMAAESLPATPLLRRAADNRWLLPQVVAGRITVGGSRLGNYSSRSSSSGKSEELSVRFNNAQRSMTYTCSTPREQLSVKIVSGDRISIAHSGKGDAKIVPVRFEQGPREPISLTLGRDDEEQVYRASTLWQLLLAHPQECRQHLVPLLDLLRPDWKLAETAAAMEAELLRAASTGQLPDRGRWAALVDQLADERFSEREAADRELRAAGRVVVGYLRGLDFGRLDAEQQFRVRRIIQWLSEQAGEDTAESFTPQVIGNPEIWLILLSRKEESTRRLAARQLGTILGEPIGFDPGAEPGAREAQLEALRARIRGKRPGAGG